MALDDNLRLFKAGLSPWPVGVVSAMTVKGS